MSDIKEYQTDVFEAFWEWREAQGIGDHEDDWSPWWDCYWEGYCLAMKTQ